MTRSSLFLSWFVAAAIAVGCLTVAANSGGEGEQSIENSLAVQKAVLQAREYLFGVHPEPKKAVDVLEAHLARINGDRKYLALLRDAYRSSLKDGSVTNQPALVDLYQKRLKILEENDGVQQVAASQPPPPQATAATDLALKAAATQQPQIKSETAPQTPAVALNAKPKTDPFDAVNEVKPTTANVVDKPNPAKGLMAKADAEFKQTNYAVAKQLYEQANQADPKILGEDGRKRWAYCQLDVVVKEINASGGKACDWAKLREEVKNAVLVAPHLAKNGEDLLASIDKRQSAASASVARPSMHFTVKHTPRGADGWQVAETDNFKVYHKQTEDYAESVAQIAESTRTTMSRKWFGKEGDAWQPKCEIRLYGNSAEYSQGTGQPGASPGHSKIDLDTSSGRVVVRQMNLRCDNPSLLDSILPHETTHVVLAGQFGKYHVPRWADEGIAVLTEPTEKIQQHRKNLIKSLQNRELIPLGELLRMENYPSAAQIGVFYAQSVALVDFLTKEKGPTVLTQFVREGLQGGYEPALRKHYGYQSIADLQSRFTERMVAETNAAQPTYVGN